MLNSFLIPRRGSSDGTTNETTADVIRREVEESDPIRNVQKDGSRLLAAGVESERVASLIMLMNAGLRQIDAISIVNSDPLTKSKIDPKTFKFKIEAADAVICDAPKSTPHDPYLARILAARLDAELILETETPLDQVEHILALRNNIKREHAAQIVQEIAGKRKAVEGVE